MKRIVKFLIVGLISMTTMAQALTERQKALAACAALEAQGDLVRLETAVTNALDKGVTINELKESFSQLYAYTGFPRSLNALGVLQKVIAKPKKEWKEGKPFERPALWNNASEALKVGTETQTKLSGKPFNYEFCPQDDYYLKAHLFGDIFAGNQLTPADREIVTVAALSGLKGVEPQLAAHKRGAVNMGNSQQLVDELCAWLDKEGYSLKSDFEKGASNVNYAKYFVGESYLNPLTPANLSKGEKSLMPMSNVTFEPGCRNNWHVHHGARQILIGVSGKGWYQEWGKPAIPMTAGTVIEIPEGVKHWHGAASDSWFQHIATHVKTGGPESNEWLEPVSDKQYNEAQGLKN
ncbi:carboxymuconolactone decarboxylase family protein [Fibrobacter sp. UWEL]|uniref:carboxymuconolactone decarboxylase family protein n=1 Tax=Fibrobacter sp. UWEL TaxID=1896209 RepID=UPI000933E638|nr:carboxymuconolactone decarboxylase family protein [Fibrobacter sp. UWEL]